MGLKAKQARQAHQRVAIFLGLFLAAHFSTHFAALGGVEAQEAVMQTGRTVYRIPIIEIVLVLALAAQVCLGIDLLRRIAKRKRRDAWHWVQFTSGCYLAYFIIMHTSAALITRLALSLDTNFYWAAGTLTLEPLRYYFAPYYTLVVTALAAHLLLLTAERCSRLSFLRSTRITSPLSPAWRLNYGAPRSTARRFALPRVCHQPDASLRSPRFQSPVPRCLRAQLQAWR